MCRSIKTLFNFEPPASNEEIRGASLQFVRKLSGFHTPSRANETAFHRAIDEIATVSKTLLDSLSTGAEPRSSACSRQSGETVRGLLRRPRGQGGSPGRNREPFDQRTQPTFPEGPENERNSREQRLNRELLYASEIRAARTGTVPMEESLVSVEFLKSSNRFIARIQSEIGGMREYTSSSFEEVLEQVVIDLQEEAESYE
jgi:hypothetical protein